MLLRFPPEDSTLPSPVLVISHTVRHFMELLDGKADFFTDFARRPANKSSSSTRSPEQQAPMAKQGQHQRVSSLITLCQLFT